MQQYVSEYEKRNIIIETIKEEIAIKLDLLNDDVNGGNPKYRYICDEVNSYVEAISKAYDEKKIFFTDCQSLFNKVSRTLSKIYQNEYTEKTSSTKEPNIYYKYFIEKNKNIKLKITTEAYKELLNNELMRNKIFAFFIKRKIKKVEKEYLLDCAKIIEKKLEKKIIANPIDESLRLEHNNESMKYYTRNANELIMNLIENPFYGRYVKKSFDDMCLNLSKNMKKTKKNIRIELKEMPIETILKELQINMCRLKNEKNNEAYYYFDEIQEYSNKYKDLYETGKIDNKSYKEVLSNIANSVENALSNIYLHKKMKEKGLIYPNEKEYEKYRVLKNKTTKLQENIEKIKAFIKVDLEKDFIIGQKVKERYIQNTYEIEKYNKKTIKRDFNSEVMESVINVNLRLQNNNSILKQVAGNLKEFVLNLSSDKKLEKRVIEKYRKWYEKAEDNSIEK